MIINYYSESEYELRYKKEDDVGLDLPCFAAGSYTAPDSFIYIKKHDIAMFDTGIYVDFPKECWGFLKERSGSAANKLFVLGGIVDPGYRGAIKSLIGNMGDDFVAENGTCLVQLILVPKYPLNYGNDVSYNKIKFNRVDSLSELSQTDRGDGGFGHTDK